MLTTTQWIDVSDWMVALLLLVAWLSTLYGALGKMQGINRLRREGFTETYLREELDFVLIGSLFACTGSLFYFLSLALNVQALEDNGLVRLFLSRLSFCVWMLFYSIHLLNGRVNAAIRFIIGQWKVYSY